MIVGSLAASIAVSAQEPTSAIDRAFRSFWSAPTAANAGEFRVAGTDRRLLWTDVARAVTYAHNLPPGMEPVLHENAFSAASRHGSHA